MFHKNDQFLLTSEECEVLLDFEVHANLQGLATKLGRDHSVVARMFKKISEKHPVVEKNAGKWTLTLMGKKINEHTRSSIAIQNSILNSQSTLRIGTNREFAARVLARDFSFIQSMFPNTLLIISAFQGGVEAALLSGQIDIGIDCERPIDPDISFKLVVDEPVVAVANKAFLQRHKKQIESLDYATLPHLFCERLSPDVILSREVSQILIAAKFDDIATTREACINGAGWALLPSYSVSSEISKGLLHQIDVKIAAKSKYGIWWARRRIYLKPSVEKLTVWLQSKTL